MSPSVNPGKVHLQDSLDFFQIGVEILDEHGAFQQDVRYGFRDLALAAAGNGTRLVAKRAVGPRTDQSPRASALLSFQPNPVAGRKHVNFVRAKRQLLPFALAVPPDPPFAG